MDDGHLPGVDDAVPGQPTATGREMRIDELAREAGTTVRNVRAYRERGLLPPPRRQGRVGLYSEAHLARLRLIGALLDRGYSLGNIADLLEAWERGRDLADVLGLEVALAVPWSDELPSTMSPEELVGMFSPGTAPVDAGAELVEALRHAMRQGVLEWDAEAGQYTVRHPAQLRIGMELVRAGVPVGAFAPVVDHIQAAMDQLAGDFVGLVLDHVVARLGDHPPPAALADLGALVGRLRPLMHQVVDAELGRAMERRVGAEFSERLARAMGQSADGAERARTVP
jgi:DNA-binding transcriptional MerR regulator